MGGFVLTRTYQRGKMHVDLQGPVRGQHLLNFMFGKSDDTITIAFDDLADLDNVGRMIQLHMMDQGIHQST